MELSVRVSIWVKRDEDGFEGRMHAWKGVTCRRHGLLFMSLNTPKKSKISITILRSAQTYDANAVLT